MDEPCNTKEQQKAENKQPTGYLSATCMSLDNDKTVKSFVEKTTINGSGDLLAALRSYYSSVPDGSKAIQTFRLHRPESGQPDNKK